MLAVTDGDYTVVEPGPGEAGRVARMLLDAAEHPRQVATVTTRTGLGFRVPTDLADRALSGLSAPAPTSPPSEPAPAPVRADEPVKQANGPVQAPPGNASKAVWSAFLAEQGVPVPAQATRDQMIGLWDAQA